MPYIEGIDDTPEGQEQLLLQLLNLRRMRADGIKSNGDLTFRDDAELAAAIADLERRQTMAEGIRRPYTINPQMKRC